MAAVTNATVAATVAENINSEWINAAVVRSLGRTRYVYDYAVLKRSLMGKSTATYSHPIVAELAAAGAHTESDLVTSVKIDRADATVGTSVVYQATFLTYPAISRSIWSEFDVAISEVVAAVKRKINDDFVALATGFSNSIGAAATNFTVANFVTMCTTWRAQVRSTQEMPILFLHGDAMRDLQNDAMSNAAALFGSVMGVQLNNAVSGLNQGELSSFNNVRITSTDDMPVGDTTGWTNMLVATGENDAAIALAYNQDIQVEIEHIPSRLGYYVIASADYGVGEVNDTAGLGVISRT